MENDDENTDLLDLTVVNSDIVIISAEELIASAGENPTKRSDAVDQVCLMIAKLRNPVKTGIYIRELSKKFKWLPKATWNQRVKYFEKTLPKEETQEITDGDYVDIPDTVDPKSAYKVGFYEHKNRYYFLTKDGSGRGLKGSNFVMKPLFHIYSKSDNNKRLLEITNSEGETKILDVQSKILASPELFFQAAFNEGAYVWHANRSHYLKVLEHISRQFPLCYELRTLGWQEEGFYAFANGIFSEGKFQPVDKFGITEHKGKKYFSPAFSSVYSDTRKDDDEYENDRYFIYRKSPITLAEWGSLMMEVYGKKAMISVSFVLATIFRDLIYDINKCFPHLFLFGEKQSGKSQLAWSLSNLFYDNQPGFNLNSGTQVGFYRNGARVKNGLSWNDEYTNEITEARFQGLKSSFDGIGHEKGKATNDSRTTVTKSNTGKVISGQWLATRDDNALLTRAILQLFQKLKYTTEQTEKFNRLKSIESKGISSLICDVLMFRDEIKDNVERVYSQIMDQIKEDMVHYGTALDERLIRNYCSFLCVMKILEGKIDYGFQYKDLYDISMEALTIQTTMISSSDSLSNFWSLVEYLLDNKQIEDGKDFIIKSVSGINVQNVKSFKESLVFQQPKDVLFIRFSKIHPLYLEAHRKQYGKNGVDHTSLVHYIKNHSSYLGYIDSYRFNNSVSSCYVFDYSQLNANLFRLQEMENLPDSANPSLQNDHETMPF